jgi:RNA polymerase sigma-70 factor (ECF subfamily)
MSVLRIRRPARARLADLLDRIARRDQTSFAELYDRTAADVLGLATFMLGDPVAAEAVTAAVYKDLWHTAAHYDPAQGSAHAWLMGLAQRHAAEHLRANREPASTTATQLAWPPPASLPPALQRLDPPTRELIMLVYYRGYTAAQAASLLSLPADTALPRLYAALRAMSPSRGPEHHPAR